MILTIRRLRSLQEFEAAERQPSPEARSPKNRRRVPEYRRLKGQLRETTETDKGIGKYLISEEARPYICIFFC